MGRKFLILAIALGLAPGTWLRTNLSTSFDTPIEVIEIDQRSGVTGPLRITGAWQLDSQNAHFGGYSALILLGNGDLYAGSDRGRVMHLRMVDGTPVSDGTVLDFPPGHGEVRRGIADLEGFTRDPETGTIWAAYEHGNVIERIMPDGAIKRAKPPQMASWSRNSGPETIVRLDDGRFLVLGEAPEGEGRTNRPGLLFSGDPVDGSEAIEFRFFTTRGYSPVDAALLPDGDVIILERRVEYAFPAKFYARLVRADPNEIAEGEVWGGGVLATLGRAYWGENFEGIEFVPGPAPAEGAEDEGAAQSGSLYLIADDNVSAFQRTLLLRLGWPPDEPQGKADRPQSGESESSANK